MPAVTAVSGRHQATRLEEVGKALGIKPGDRL